MVNEQLFEAKQSGRQALLYPHFQESFLQSKFTMFSVNVQGNNFQTQTKSPMTEFSEKVILRSRHNYFGISNIKRKNVQVHQRAMEHCHVNRLHVEITFEIRMKPKRSDKKLHKLVLSSTNLFLQWRCPDHKRSATLHHGQRICPLLQFHSPDSTTMELDFCKAPTNLF